MSHHAVGSHQEWLAARLELLDAEKEHTRAADELARRRRELPWVRIEKDYRFQTADGQASLRDLFGGRSQLLVYHFMFPGCPSCGSMADGFDGFVVHLEHHDVAFVAVCRSPIDELESFKARMGWRLRFASSAGSDFNYDFGVSFSDEQIAAGAASTISELGGCRRAPSTRRTTYPVRARSRSRRWRPPHLLKLRSRRRRALGHVPVARPSTARAQRDPGGLVSRPRRVRRLTLISDPRC